MSKLDGFTNGTRGAQGDDAGVRTDETRPPYAWREHADRSASRETTIGGELRRSGAA